MAQSIKDAVLPLKQAAEDRARKTIVDLIDKTLTDLLMAGNDLNVIAPYPRSGVGRKEYHIRLARRNFIESITKSVKSSRRMDEPHTRLPDTDRIARVVENCIEAATAAYDAYVFKLTGKIGDVTDANLLTTSGLWYDSKLAVVLPDGSTQTWSTKCILNCSSLGKVFNQWPTRLLK